MMRWTRAWLLPVTMLAVAAPAFAADIPIGGEGPRGFRGPPQGPPVQGQYHQRYGYPGYGPPQGDYYQRGPGWGPGWGPGGWRGGGYYGPPRRQLPSGPGQYYRGQWIPQGQGPCWTFIPVLGWQWTCGV